MTCQSSKKDDYVLMCRRCISARAMELTDLKPAWWMDVCTSIPQLHMTVSSLACGGTEEI